MGEEDRWGKLEALLRRVLREELAALGKKPKINLVGGRWTGITQEQMESWSAAYGAVDLEAELKRAAAWCVSNPSIAPKSQMARFLNTWLTKEQNRRSLQSIPTVRSIAEKTCEYCGAISAGSINGYNPCSKHWQNAMDGDKPMGQVKRA